MLFWIISQDSEYISKVTKVFTPYLDPREWGFLVCGKVYATKLFTNTYAYYTILDTKPNNERYSMEFNEAKYKECEEDYGHEYGYGEKTGVCTHCGLIHDCDTEDKFEFDGDNYRCEVCHLFPSHDVLKEIEQANADDRDRELEYRSSLL